MASHKPAAGKSVPAHALPHAATTHEIDPAPAASGMVSRQHISSPQPVERIAGVRIIRGHAWSGVCLRLADGAASGQMMHADLMELSLVTPDGRSIIIASIDGDEAVAVWRAASAASGLAMVVETSDGLLQAPFPQMGRVALGAIRIRRAHGVMNGRRPRFLKRRKTGCLPDRPVMVRGEVLSGGF